MLMMLHYGGCLYIIVTVFETTQNLKSLNHFVILYL